MDDVDYENRGGKGGTLGLAYYAEKYSNDPNAMLMGGMVMVGAVALQKPAVDMSRIQPVARLTSDYLVLVVAANSPIRTVADLAARIRANPKEVPIAGGSAGGVDHVLAGAFTRGTVDMANWRGVFTGQGVSAARQSEMMEAVRAATGHETWQKTLRQNRWESSWLAGPGFNSFIDVDLTTSRVMVHLLRLKA